MNQTKCLSCSRPAAPNRSRCEQCLQSSRAARRRYVDANRDAIKAQQRASRLSRLANGKCSCGAELADGRTRCQACLGRHRDAHSAKRQERKATGVCRTCGGSVDGLKSHCDVCLDRISKNIAAARMEVIVAYGGRCACCGEKEHRFLQIDHVHSDGATERASGIATGRLYRKLKRLGFPRDRYQLLCANCNHGRYLNGGVCPHKTT